MKRIAIAAGILFVLFGIVAAVVARSVLTGDNVRAAVAAQLTAALGQPVTIGGLGASVYPRVTMDLSDVTIGGPGRLRFGSMHLETGLRALFSRRIEGAVVRIDDATITLPLPAFGGGAAPSESASSSAPVEIVSIDEIRLRDVEIISGDRKVQGDVELVPRDRGVEIKRIALAADGMQIEMSGTLASLSPVEGRIEAKAGTIDLDRMLAFLDAFSSGSAQPEASPGKPSSAFGAGGRLTLALKADRVTTGGLTLSDLNTTAAVTPGAVTFEPLAFGIFSGRYEGTLQATLSGTPGFRWRAAIKGVDTAALMAFAGSPDTITGSLAGTVALDGTGLQMEQALRTAHGNARVEITDGTIRGLSLVRTIVTAGSGRGGMATSLGAAGRGDAAGSERFSRLSATLRFAGGRMITDDVAMHSTDVDLTAGGAMRLESMTTDFAGRVQLSEALSRQAGTDLYRYAQEGGRVTLPVTLTGPIAALDVRVDLADAASRALRNTAEEEAKKAIERNLPKGLKGLFGKKGGG